MIDIKQSKYESIIADLINSKDINSLVSVYSKDRVYFCSVLNDIGNKNSLNSKIVQNAARNFKLSESYIREQANSLFSYLYPKPPDKDYYKIMGVSSAATKEEIRKNWTKLMKDNHPDLVGDAGLDASRKINEAYSVLRDDKQKDEYDSKRLPLLPVNVEISHSNSFAGLKKAALVMLPVLFIVAAYFVFSSKEQRTELANFQSTNLDKNEILADSKLVDANSKILEQIENIEPKKKNIVKSPKNSNQIAVDNNSIENEPSGNKEIVKTDGKEIEYKFETAEDVEKKVAEDTTKNIIAAKKDLKTASETNIVPTVKSEKLKIEKVSQEVKKAKNSAASKNIIKENKKDALVKEVIQSPPQVSKVIKVEPSNSTLFRFISDYVTAYKDMDVDRIKSLFLVNAMENGMPISKAIEGYSKNFNANSIIKYDVKVNKTSIKNSEGYIDSDFNIVFKKLSNDQVKTSSGSIKWNLLWNETNWKIKDINYNILDTKRMDEPL